MTTPIRALADELAQRLLSADPFLGTQMGLRAYDALVPDVSAEAEQQLRADLGDVEARAAGLEPHSASDRATQQAILAHCDSRRRTGELGAIEYTVTPQPEHGPPLLLSMTAVVTIPSADAAADYLRRLRASGELLDRTTARLGEGAAKGRLPVASLTDLAMEWCDRTLAESPPAALVPSAPDGWDGAAAWREEVETVAREQIVPAIARWRERIVELRPRARSDERPGLASVPGGDADYESAIAVHTTLPLTADELHRTGLDTIAALEAGALELGDRLGLRDFEAVLAAAAASVAEQNAVESLEAARAAVARAEQRAAEIMPAPLPGPCAVEPMPRTVAESGMAPHYSPPQRDGSRPGTYWFNTVRPSAGAGWDLEAVAFHEAVPGHHSQLARLQLVENLPLLQQFYLTVHGEGWGLYAERLAGEFGLYSSVEAQLGAIGTELFRAARLVVDTGLHAFGWSRRRAIDYMTAHVPLPPDFIGDEVNRYIAWPGQALAYLTGQREILRLREQARAALGDRFDLPEFNAAVLDSGSLPMPALAAVVTEWSTSQGVAPRTG